MKKFKNNLSRKEMRTIYAGGGKGTVPITPECGDVCQDGHCGNASCPTCVKDGDYNKCV